ncbi:MAG: hypothetical protein R3A47_03190 [Polyangiales bacterium]
MKTIHCLTFAMLVAIVPFRVAAQMSDSSSTDAKSLDGPPPDSIFANDAVEQTTDTTKARVQHLLDTMDDAAKKNKKRWAFAAAQSLVSGTTLAAMGFWRLSEKQPANQFSRGLGVMFLSLAATDLAVSITGFRSADSMTAAINATRDMVTQGIDERDAIHLEGMLHGASVTEHRNRLKIDGPRAPSPGSQ